MKRKDIDDKIPDNCKYFLANIQASQNKKQTNAGGLAKLLKLKIGAKKMLTVNLDIQDRQSIVFIIRGNKKLKEVRIASITKYQL